LLARDAQRLAMLDARLLAHEPRELHDRTQLAHIVDHLGTSASPVDPTTASSAQLASHAPRDDRRALRPPALIEWQRC
jgi:hypothetical protein